MNINIKEIDGGLTAVFSGRLDTPAAVKAQQEIVPLLEQADKEIILDCTDLEYVRKETAAKGGKVIIKNINDEIKKVFMMTGFFNLFDIR